MNKQAAYQGYFADCYVLSAKRNVEFLNAFIQRFVPKGRVILSCAPGSDEPFSESLDSVLNHLAANSDAPYKIYIEQADDSGFRGAQLFFTRDGQVILGVYCETMHPNTTIEDRFFSELKEFTGEERGFIGYEEEMPFDSEADRKSTRLNASH